MTRDSKLTWFDGLLKGTRLPYPVLSLIIGVIIYIIYLFFGRMIEHEWTFEDKLNLSLIGILIAYELSGLQYLLDKFKIILSHLNLLNIDNDGKSIKKFDSVFADPYWFISLVVLVILPFYITDWISPTNFTLMENYSLMQQFLPDYAEKPTYWILVFDIYNWFLGFLALFLLACILWIVLNITQTIRAEGSDVQNLSLNTNAFSVHMKLRPIKSSILMIIFYYFVCISLIYLSYGLTDYLFEKIILLSLLVIGLTFFFSGYESLYGLVRRQAEFEMDQLNKKKQDYTKKLLAIDSTGDYESKIKETNFISNMLDVLQKQRDSLTNTDTKIYDLRSIIGIISAFMLPILTDYVKKNINNMLQAGDFFNQGLSMINSLFHK
jgi:hypothetical protein